MISRFPIICIAAIVDRPNNERYKQKYGSERWRLCKTAFSILAGRSRRVSLKRKKRLRIFAEESGKREDNALRTYYAELRENGMPFNRATSEKYAPLSVNQIRFGLYDLKFKKKTSSLVQLSDLTLYPMALGGYDPSYRPYEHLRQCGKLIDCLLAAEDVAYHGIKYSCFDFKSAPPHKKLD